MHLPTHPLVSCMCITFFLHKCTGHTFLADITPFACEWSSLIHHHPLPSSITVTCHHHLLLNRHRTCCQTRHYPLSHPLLPPPNCHLPVGGQIPAYVIIAMPIAACCCTCLLGGQNPASAVANTVAAKFVIATCQVE